MQAKFVAGSPAVVRTVVVTDAPEAPAKVVLEIPVEAAGWLMAFAGDHNGSVGNNPIQGLYEKLERIPEVRAANEKALPRLRKLLDRYTAASRIIDVLGVR